MRFVVPNSLNNFDKPQNSKVENIMRKFAILFLTAILSVGLYAQNLTGKISGTVSSDGQPLVGANVILEGTSSGAATDENGTYYIFDVQPGIYVIRVNYIGYKAQVVSNVRVTIGLTTVQDFELEVAAVEGEVVEVTAEKPLIEITSTNVSRSIDSEAIDNYAVRSVNSIIANQAGVVQQHDGMHIRGSRSEEIGYTLEGAPMSGAGGKVVSNAIPEALEALAVQVGGYDASVGKANAGLVQQSLKTGGNKFSGSFLIENDGMAESFGTNVYDSKDITFTVSGPISNKIRYMVAFQNGSTDNYKPSFYTPVTIAGGALLPDKIGGLTASGDSISIVSPETANGNWEKFSKLNTTFQFDFNPLVIRASLTMNKSQYSNAGLPIQTMFNSRRHVSDNSNQLFNVKATYFLNANTYIRTNFRTMGRKYESYDKSFADEGKFTKGHKSELKDWLAWGDRDAIAAFNSTWAGNFGTPGQDATKEIYRYVEPTAYNVFGFKFARDGTRRGGYSKGEDGYVGFDAEFVTQMGEHEVKVGADYTRYVYKRYGYWGIQSLNSKIGQDATLYDKVVAQDDQVVTEIVTARLASWIGYDPLGRDCGDSGSKCEDYDEVRNPSQMAFYINDKFEAGDLIVNLGLRYESINQANVDLKDYANPPLDRNYTIVAAEDANYGFKDMPAQSYLLPRIGLGFPITDRATFHLNYGRYVQMAPMGYLYRSRGSGISSWGLEPVKEDKFEIGYGQLIGNFASIDITVFSRNPYDQVARDLYIPDATQNVFGLRSHTNYVNADFTTSTGIEIDFKTSRFNNIQLFANYVFLDARGTNSYPGSLQGNIGVRARRPTMLMATRYAQRHRGNLILDFRTGRSDNPLLSNFGANLIAEFNSGHPYTASNGSMGQRDADEGALLADNDPRNRVPTEAINSSTTPWYFNLNLGLDKTFRVANTNVKVYATITNLLNTKHIINVYNRTGDAYDDGFLTDPALSSKIIEGRGATYVEMYQKINLENRQHWLNDHGWDLFGTPREIKTGISVSF